MGGEDVQPPQPLPWYPRNLAWQMAFSRAQLRKLDGLTQVHEFMKRENEGGGITRQEAVSMIPPLFLDVQPHHLVG
jgi:16S rRNA C967 or C1407 C5-methylase (RsmB/RsmF family)